MRTKELEEQLGITKENLRYYEKEGLITPARSDNGYRDYSEEDAERLKKILVMRRLGITIAEIRDVLEEKRTLQAVLFETLDRLDQEISSIQEARVLCAKLAEEDVTIKELDGDLYLKEIEEEQARGGRFADITKDVIANSKELITESFGHLQFFFPVFKPLLWKRKRKGSGVLAAVMVVLFLLGGGNACARASMRNNMPDRPYFLIGVLTFALIFVFWLFLRNIIWYLTKKYPRYERVIAISGSILCALLCLGLDAAAVFHWSHILMFTKNTGTPVFRDETAEFIQINRDDEIPNPDNDFTMSHQSRNYYACDPAYIKAVTDAIASCRSSGRWSVTASDLTLYQTNQLLKKIGKDPGHFWQILWYGGDKKDNGRYTFFYLYQDEQMGWVLDEPQYGLYHAGDDLVYLVQHYQEYIEIQPGIIDSLRMIFEYDPKRIWPNETYKDGRFDTYRYLILKDRTTGEDVTQKFIDTYMPAYKAQDWETLIEAREGVQESWHEEYVHPEDAHFEK